MMRKDFIVSGLIFVSVCFTGMTVNAQVDEFKQHLNNFQDYEYSDNYLAKQYLDSAEILLPKLTDPLLLGDFYIHEGWYFQDISKYENSRESFFKALKEFQKINAYQEIADAYGNIGNAYFDVDALSESLEYHQKSLMLNEKIAHMAEDSVKIQLAERGKAITFTNLAAIYYILKDYDKSLEYEKAGLFYEINNGDSLGMAISYQGIGGVYEKMGQDDSAYFYLNYSKQIFEKEQYSYGLIRSLRGLADLEKDSVKSRKYLLRALDIALESNDRVSELSIMGNLLNDRFDLPKDTQNQFVQRISSIQKDSVLARMTFSVYKNLGHYYYRNNLFEKASDSYKIYISNFLVEQEQNEKSELKSELVRNELQIKSFSDSLKIQNEFAKKSLENEKKISRQRAIILLAISGGIIMLGMLFFLVKSVKTKNKNNRLLNAKNQRIQEQKELVDEKNKQITDSINYAKRLQGAILPPISAIAENLNDAFVLFKPKDVVSGDFYWFEKKNNLIFIAAADCTGHGVPGAMVSVVCANALNRAVNEFEFTRPSDILDKTREIVIETFARSGEDVKDGMDISLCVINKEKRQLSFSGANNPLWVCGPTEEMNLELATSITSDDFTLSDVKGDKQPVGLYSKNFAFSQLDYDYSGSETFYIFTDGYADQFGGDSGKKMKYKTLKQLILKNQTLSLAKQNLRLDQFLVNWMGDLEQLDDICIIGFRP